MDKASLALFVWRLRKPRTLQLIKYVGICFGLLSNNFLCSINLCFSSVYDSAQSKTVINVLIFQWRFCKKGFMLLSFLFHLFIDKINMLYVWACVTIRMLIWATYKQFPSCLERRVEFNSLNIYHSPSWKYQNVFHYISFLYLLLLLYMSKALIPHFLTWM